MSNYFSYFPTTPHDLTNIGQTVQLTNIIRRFKIKSNILTEVRVYHDYQIQSGERPDTIADKFYGDSGYAWLVLMFNEIKDPIFGWPLFGVDFDNYIKGKYGNLATAKSTVHEYRKVLTQKSVQYDGFIIEKRAVVVDSTTYAGLSVSSRESISKYDWEIEENEKKRKIKLLHERYLPSVRKQVQNILKDGV